MTCRQHPVTQESILLHIPSPEKDQYSKFEVQILPNVYHFCTIIKWKIVNQTIISQGPFVLKMLKQGKIFCLICSFIYLSVFLVSTCSAVEFRCADGTCIPRSARCNQNIDCADASDEKSCSKIFHYLLLVHAWASVVLHCTPSKFLLNLVQN